MQANRPLESQGASQPPTKLEKILRQAGAQMQKQQEEARQLIERESRRREEQQRGEALRGLFHKAFVVAERFAPAPKHPERAKQLTARLMVLGQGIVAAELGRLLERLPRPGTPNVPHYLPLRFAIGLLQEARDGSRERVRAALDGLHDHSNLSNYYKWFGVLADRFCGFVDAMLGVPGKIVEAPPLPEGYLTPAAYHEVEWALRFPHGAYFPQPQVPGLAGRCPTGTGDSVDSESEPGARLSGRQFDILEALYRLQAFTCDSSRTSAEIAKKAEGNAAHPENFKNPLAILSDRGLVCSKVGRGGGYWLSSRGRALIKRVRGL